MSALKYKSGDKVRIKDIDWYNKNKDSNGDVVVLSKVPHFSWYENVRTVFTKDMAKFCGKVVTIESVWSVNYSIVEGTYRDGINIDYFTDEMIEGLVEEETPKFKVNDIVFVKNIGLIRIKNSYWDSLANEYIYEAIGFNGEGEYDSINESNIECQMLPESENPHTGGNKITLDEYKNNDKEWLFNKLAMLDNITALESIQDIFNHLQQSKYPKTYEECCDVLSIQSYYKLRYYTYEHGYNEYATSNKLCSLSDKLNILGKLLICLDAYWKIAGDEMGLGKPWEPDWNNISDKYCIYFVSGDAWLKECQTRQCLFAFPTAEMRDAFYENFKEEIENVKELL